MRRMSPPTLDQWTCPHRWKVIGSWPQSGFLYRKRYLKCLRCGLHAKTIERPAVPWDERDLVALVKALLPEGKPVYLREKGITALPLYGLNTLLEPQGYVIHAAKVRDAKRFVACTDKHGRVERFGLFELRPIRQEAPGRANGKRRRGR